MFLDGDKLVILESSTCRSPLNSLMDCSSKSLISRVSSGTLGISPGSKSKHRRRTHSRSAHGRRRSRRHSRKHSRHHSRSSGGRSHRSGQRAHASVSMPQTHASVSMSQPQYGYPTIAPPPGYAYVVPQQFTGTPVIHAPPQTVEVSGDFFGTTEQRSFTDSPTSGQRAAAQLPLPISPLKESTEKGSATAMQRRGSIPVVLGGGDLGASAEQTPSDTMVFIPEEPDDTRDMSDFDEQSISELSGERHVDDSSITNLSPSKNM